MIRKSDNPGKPTVAHAPSPAGPLAVGEALARDQRGVSAVEFALIAPVLILMLLGMSDVAPSAMAVFKLNHTTESVGDLTGEFSQMQTSDMVSVYSAVPDVIAPFPSTNLSVRLTNIYSDGNGHAYVYWSCGQGALPAYAAKSQVTSTPTGNPVSYFLYMNNTTSGSYILNGTNTSYIMAESSYVYTPPASFVIRTPLTLTHVAYLLPRQSSYVGFPWDGVTTDANTAPASTTTTSSVTLTNGVVCNYAH